jgi:NAD(P)H-dependent flavin oxidoreductase YrpB (nitropropane dioxygenase family)
LLPGGPFGDGQCALVEEFRPEVVSFHVGLPAPELLARVKATARRMWSGSGTTFLRRVIPLFILVGMIISDRHRFVRIMR